MTLLDYFLSLGTRLAPYLFLILIPFRNHLRCSFRRGVLYAVLFYLGTTLIVYLFGETYGINSIWMLPFTCFFLAFCLFLAYHVLRTSLRKLLFLILLIENYSDIVLMFSEILETHLAGLLPGFSAVGLVSLCRMLVFVLSAPLIHYFLTHQVLPVWEHEDTPEIWSMLWLIPASFYLIYRLGFTSSIAALHSEITSPLLLAIVWTAGTFLSYYATLSMINFNEEKQQLQHQLQVQEYQALIRDKQAERLAASIASTRQTRHDLHHYLLTLKTYMNQGETEKLQDSLNQFISNFESSIKTPVCENLLFSAIVRYYMDMAEESGIEFTTSIVLPPSLAIKDTDLTVILGNMLENAMEACLRQTAGEAQFIEVKSRMQGNNGLVLQCRNSYNGQVKKQDETFLSSKREGEGIGLSSIRTLCAKYHGVLKITPKDNTFTVNLLLNLPAAA